MRKEVHKWFWAWDFDKEEKWLNEMAAKGLSLIAIGYCKYTFEDCLPGEYNIRLELLDNTPSNAESVKYIEFVEETGAEYLGSVMRWVYFRKKTDDGEFNLFSDNASRVKHLMRLLLLLGVLAAVELVFGLSNVSMYFSNGMTANLYVGFLCLAVGALFSFGFLKVNRIKQRLKKELQLFE